MNVKVVILSHNFLLLLHSSSSILIHAETREQEPKLLPPSGYSGLQVAHNLKQKYVYWWWRGVNWFYSHKDCKKKTSTLHSIYRVEKANQSHTFCRNYDYRHCCCSKQMLHCCVWTEFKGKVTQIAGRGLMTKNQCSWIQQFPNRGMWHSSGSSANICGLWQGVSCGTDWPMRLAKLVTVLNDMGSTTFKIVYSSNYYWRRV